MSKYTTTTTTTFDGPPEHFACLHVKKSTVVYYDSLKENSDGRPFSEYPELRDLGEIEIHEPDVWQAEVECGFMVVLRYWQLFQGKRYILNGKKARDQVMKYYFRNTNKGGKSKSPSSRMLGSSFMERLH